jgi:ribosomal protein S12 methylthiotransferase
MLVAGGVKELILVAQDTTAYGLDLDPRASLAGLIERLSSIDGLAWIRVMYAYPGRVTRELIKVMAEQPKVCAYLDLPLQHASPLVLRAMGRKGGQNLPALIRRLRQAMPDISLRTTFMVGFPGETDEDFDRLTAFVQEARFDHVGVFKFSPEQGTLAAKRSGQAPGRIKEIRRRRLMALQRKISREKNRAKVGEILPVLVEGFSPETDLLLVGRTPGQAPDVDGVVYITRGTAQAGEIRRVAITQAHDYDLAGELAD